MESLLHDLRVGSRLLWKHKARHGESLPGRWGDQHRQCGSA